MDSQFVDALTRLFSTVINKYGCWGTIGILLLAFIVAAAWRVYNDKREDKEIDLLIQEKERTIQRLANESREQKVLIFKEVHKWTDQQIEKFIHKNSYNDPIEARNSLEMDNSNGK